MKMKGRTPLQPDDAGSTTLLLERLLAVIDEGRRTGTHKLLTLMALMDTEAASVDDDLRPTAEVPVAEVAEHVIEIAWPHVVPCAVGQRAVRLHQMSGRRPNELIDATAEARTRADELGVRTPRQLAAADPHAHERARGRVLRQLIKYPLALLQHTDRDAPDFLFTSWGQEQSPTAVAHAQGRDTPTIQWLPGSAEALIRYAALLRPVVETTLIRDVAAWNDLDTAEGRLRQHLFGTSREAWPDGLKEELLAAQDRRCFYDPDGPRHRPDDLQLDHFLPWSRFHVNGTANIVLATSGRNTSKSDLFAAVRHVDTWRHSLRSRTEVANRLGLDAEADRALALARAGYGHLPDGSPLWLARVRGSGGREVERLHASHRSTLAELLGKGGPADDVAQAAEETGPWSP